MKSILRGQKEITSRFNKKPRYSQKCWVSKIWPVGEKDEEKSDKSVIEVN